MTIIYKILFHQDIFSSYPHSDHIFINWMFIIVPAKILGVPRAFEGCLKWLRKLYLSSSVTCCRYQIAATNSYSSFSKDGWTKPYFLFIQPVKSSSIALNILHWYRWVPLPTIPLTPEADANTPNYGLVQLEGQQLLHSLQLQSRVFLSHMVAPALNLVQGWSPFAAATTQAPHHHPFPAPIALVPFPYSPVTGQKRFSSCHIHQQHQGHTANTT